MNPAAIYYVLYLMSANGYEGPLGIYVNPQACEREGGEVSAITDRKHKCRPATEAAVRYLAGSCLGDQLLCAYFFRPSVPLPQKPAKEGN